MESVRRADIVIVCRVNFIRFVLLNLAYNKAVAMRNYIGRSHIILARLAFSQVEINACFVVLTVVGAIDAAFGCPHIGTAERRGDRLFL